VVFPVSAYRLTEADCRAQVKILTELCMTGLAASLFLVHDKNLGHNLRNKSGVCETVPDIAITVAGKHIVREERDPSQRSSSLVLAPHSC
jgi:hypothetical protein